MARTFASLRPLLAVIVFTTPVWVSIERNRNLDRQRRELVQKEAARDQVETASAREQAVRRNASDQKFGSTLGVHPSDRPADDSAATR